MNFLNSRSVRRRAAAYGGLAAVLLAGAFAVHWIQWQSSRELHTELETIAAVLALVAGVNALVRYYTRKTAPYLIAGCGLVGAGLFDAYHAAATSAFFASWGHSPLSLLTGWSGLVSRLFLSVVMFACWRVRQRAERPETLAGVTAARIYANMGLCALGCFLFCTLVRLPPAYDPTVWLHLPSVLPARALLDGLLFAIALAGFLRTGDWKTDGFEHWRILFLITAVVADTVYVPFSARAYDASYICAHALKILGYLFIVCGLLHSKYTIFQREAAAADSLRNAHEALAHEVEERQRAEERLRIWNDELEERVAARNLEVAERSRLAAMTAEAGAALGRGGSLQAGLQACAEIVVRRLDAALVRIWTLDTGGQELELQASAGLYRHLDGPHGRIPLGTGHVGRIGKTGKPVFRNRMGDDPELDANWVQSQAVAAFAGLPLLLDGHPSGVVAVFSRQTLSKHAFGALESLAAEISLGIARQRAEEKLKTSHDRFRLAAANASDLVWEWDPAAGKIEYFGTGNRVLGGGVVPAALGELRQLHPADRGRVMASFEQHRASGEPIGEEYRVLLESGEIRYWSMRATLLRGTGASGVWIGASSDITERKRRETEIAKLASIVEFCEAAVMSVTPEGKVEIWNPAAERMFGYTAEEMIGQQFSITMPPERAGEPDPVGRTMTLGESVRSKETVRMAKNGSRVEVLVTGFPLRDSRGAVVSAAAIMSDITERKQLERQLAQAQKLESIGQLAAGVAHEINTPVQFIGDNIRFLEESFGDLDQLLAVYAGMREAARSGRIDEAVIAGVEAREALADVDYLREEIPKSIAQSAEGVERIAAIVKAIREFSHPGAAEKAPVDLNRAVETTTLVSRNEWKYVADLQLDLAPGLPMVSCVRGEINQVILNLVVNAAHAIAEKTGGTAEKGQITVTTRADGEWAEVRVSDTGTGIPEKAQANVFNPFFTTKPVGKGTGQGLAIAHMVVVQKHRGTIHFETEPGKGTTFIVRLPINGTGKQAVMEPAA